MAGALALSQSDEAGLGIDVRTAGLVAQTRLGVSAYSVDVMGELGVDISGHTPTELDQDLVSWADWIVPMERHQCHEIQRQFPDSADKLRPFEFDIDDPYGADKVLYRECRDRIARAIRVWLATLQ